MTETPSRNSNGSRAVLIGVGVILAVCCACVLILGAAGVVAYERIKTSIPVLPTFELPDNDVPSVEPTLARPPAESISNATRATLETAVIPESDPYELACRLKGICNVPETLDPPAVPPKVGDKQKFWISNSNTDENFQIEAELLYITPHTYFWAERPRDVNMDDLKRLMDTFEEKIYPKDREFFGNEWTPGVDGDPHIYVVYADNIGHTVAGYFSSADSYNPAVREFSNGHEMYVLGASQNLADEYTYSALAHEFVHMIQFASDRNDVSWINEGFAEVGAFINGYDVGFADRIYAQSPDLQLNDWADANSPDFGAHYGLSFLYLTYFLDRFGEDATKALTANPENDLPSVDDTLASLNIADPLTGDLVNADDVYLDWATAMYVMDKTVGDGRFYYYNYPDAPKTRPTDVVSACPAAPFKRTVHQYGVDYIKVACAGAHTLRFEGSTAVPLLPVSPHSGKAHFWSNRGDESDMTLTREFDLTGVSGPVTLSYWTWFDIEENWDYLNLEVSENGQSWTILKTPSGTDKNPQGNAYGWGYTGKSNDWIQEEVDLSAYAGKKIQIRFEYITDAALNGEGLLLDDVTIDAIGYSEDFESGDGGWVSEGFARVENVLRQTFRLALVVERNGKITVQPVETAADQTVEIPLELQPGDSATLIVAGVTRFTRNLASYSIEVR